MKRVVGVREAGCPCSSNAVLLVKRDVSVRKRGCCCSWNLLLQSVKRVVAVHEDGLLLFAKWVATLPETGCCCS